MVILPELLLLQLYLSQFTLFTLQSIYFLLSAYGLLAKSQLPSLFSTSHKKYFKSPRYVPQRPSLLVLEWSSCGLAFQLRSQLTKVAWGLCLGCVALEPTDSVEPQFLMTHEFPQILPAEASHSSSHRSLRCSLEVSVILLSLWRFSLPLPPEGMEKIKGFWLKISFYLKLFSILHFSLSPFLSTYETLAFIRIAWRAY